MTTGVVGAALGAAQLGATFSGVPFAAGSVMVLQMINTACSEVSMHKYKCRQLVERCTLLQNLIDEQASLLVGMEACAAFDQAEGALEGVRRRLQKWADCGKVRRFLKSAQIGRDLDKCSADVNHAMERLHVVNPVAVLRMQKQSIDMMQHQQAVLAESIHQLQISPREIQRAVEQHISGGNEAFQLMRVGQERLMSLGGRAPVSPSIILSDSQEIVRSPLSSRPPSPVATVQHQIEQALLDLVKLTNIPPTIPILNNQVKKMSVISTRGGPYSEVFEGRWLGEMKVALKTIRIMDEHDPKAKRLQMRFEHEIVVWSKLKHENVLTMLGIVTDMGPIHVVSPWALDNARNYRYDHPDINPLKLLCQAAKGLEYLHDQQIVHGNLKCNNILVSEEGTITLSDFGLTQVLTDVVGKEAMVILTNTSAIRWHAPELYKSEDATPTMHSDIFAFGMSVLELLTMKPPYSHRRRDISVVQDVTQGILPPRPEEPEAAPWVSDGLWDILCRCWKWDPKERMLAKELLSCLEQASASGSSI